MRMENKYYGTYVIDDININNNKNKKYNIYNLILIFFAGNIFNFLIVSSFFIYFQIRYINVCVLSWFSGFLTFFSIIISYNLLIDEPSCKIFLCKLILALKCLLFPIIFYFIIYNMLLTSWDSTWFICFSQGLFSPLFFYMMCLTFL